MREIKTVIYDEKNRGPHRHDPDIVQEFNGNIVVVPKDTAFGTSDQHASEPDWSKGWYLQDRNTGQPLPDWTVENGPPPPFFIKCWKESNRPLVGVIAGRDEARHN
jgi:hypothetical protein